MRTRTDRVQRVVVILGLACFWPTFGACATEGKPTEPTLADTNVAIKAGNFFRRQIASSLSWRPSLSANCNSLRHRIETVAADQPLIDPVLLSDSAIAEIDAQQRAEENSLALLAVFSELIYEAIRGDCLMAPGPAKAGDDQSLRGL